MKTLRTHLILVLMLVLPLQGLAAVLMPLQKASDAQAAAMPCHAAHHAPADAAPGMDRSAPAPDATHDSANHLCCHQVYTCAPLGVFSASAWKFSDVSRFVLPLATLFIPDSPDRPPRG